MCCVNTRHLFSLTRVPVESPEALKGAIELDHAATVKRTKNVRDGFMYCIRVDAPNAGKGASSVLQPKVKRWTKLVMVLSSEPEMTAWIDAIRWALKSAVGSVSEMHDVDVNPGQAVLAVAVTPDEENTLL
jgi:hypothetical protein